MNKILDKSMERYNEIKCIIDRNPILADKIDGVNYIDKSNIDDTEIPNYSIDASKMETMCHIPDDLEEFNLHIIGNINIDERVTVEKRFHMLKRLCIKADYEHISLEFSSNSIFIICTGYMIILNVVDINRIELFGMIEVAPRRYNLLKRRNINYINLSPLRSLKIFVYNFAIDANDILNSLTTKVECIYQLSNGMLNYTPSHLDAIINKFDNLYILKMDTHNAMDTISRITSDHIIELIFSSHNNCYINLNYTGTIHKSLKFIRELNYVDINLDYFCMLHPDIKYDKSNARGVGIGEIISHDHGKVTKLYENVKYYTLIDPVLFPDLEEYIVPVVRYYDVLLKILKYYDHCKITIGELSIHDISLRELLHLMKIPEIRKHRNIFDKVKDLVEIMIHNGSDDIID